MTTPAPGSEALFEALDVASIKMLQLLDPSASETDDGGDLIEVPALTKVKIFAAVTEYAALRAAKEPPKLREGKFNGLRERFHGDETPRRARKPRAGAGGDE